MFDLYGVLGYVEVRQFLSSFVEGKTMAERPIVLSNLHAISPGLNMGLHCP
jgi:hypothetical protein